jgi:hypothetical protein
MLNVKVCAAFKEDNMWSSRSYDLGYIEHLKLEEWQHNHDHVEDDGEFVYQCPSCGYDLDIILIDDEHYVWCHNGCFKKEYNQQPLLLFVG